MARTKGLPQGFRRKEGGKLEYRFVINCKRYSVTGSSVKECRDKETEKRAAVAAGYVCNEKITVNQYFDEWMKQKARTVKESTLYTQKSAMKAILDRIGGERITGLERRRLVALQSELAENYTTGGVNHKFVLLKSLLSSAVTDEIIPKNPAAGIKPLKRTEPEARDTIHRALTLEEQTAFFRAAAGSWYENLFRFLIMTGLRIGEAGALRWSDIDTRNDVIRVRHTIVSTAAGRKIGNDTKSKSGMRDIPLTDGIRDVLRNQKQQNIDVFGDKVIGQVFMTPSGDNVFSEPATREIKRICEEAGIDRISVHAFRDTFATRAIESGMNPNTLKTILGHSSLAMTMDLYAHVLPNTKAEEMQKIVINL